MPKQYEYFIATMEMFDTNTLNKLGEQGWEMVSTVPHDGTVGATCSTLVTCYMKREKIDNVIVKSDNEYLRQHYHA